MPYIKRGAAARRQARRHRSRARPRWRDRPTSTSPIRPGTDVAVALAIHRHLFESGAADQAFLAAHTTGADAAARARPAVDVRARGRGERAVAPTDIERLARLYATRRRRSSSCGWGLERNRNGGSAAMAILALPAVGGKFGVRGGGYSMSNSASWGINRTWLADARAADPHRQHEPCRPRAARAVRAHADPRCCSSTTAIRR